MSLLVGTSATAAGASFSISSQSTTAGGLNGGDLLRQDLLVFSQQSHITNSPLRNLNAGAGGAGGSAGTIGLGNIFGSTVCVLSSLIVLLLSLIVYFFPPRFISVILHL